MMCVGVWSGCGRVAPRVVAWDVEDQALGMRRAVLPLCEAHVSVWQRAWRGGVYWVLRVEDLGAIEAQSPHPLALVGPGIAN